MLNICLYKLGDNLIFKSKQLEYTQEHFEIECSCCDTQIYGIRYICLSCKDEINFSKPKYSKKINFCYSCFSIMNDSLDMNYNKYCNKSIEIKHDPKTHAYLVLYFKFDDFRNQSLSSF